MHWRKNIKPLDPIILKTQRTKQSNVFTLGGRGFHKSMNSSSLSFLRSAEHQGNDDITIHPQYRTFPIWKVMNGDMFREQTPDSINNFPT
jgi:hypothetical protein